MAYNGELMARLGYAPPQASGREGGAAVDTTDQELKRMSEETVQEAVSEEVFSGYQATTVTPGAIKHPGNIVEAASLSAVPLPEATYKLASSIPNSIIKGGKLSNLQLEGIQYACQRHQKILANGCRAGFFMGDAAGVGKGRQISGIILDNYVRGRRKHIWFSISSDLKVDAQRDVNDLGCHIKIIEGCQHLDRETRAFGLSASMKEGVVFSTYATLVSSVQKGVIGRQSRLKQLIEWCGGDQFDGCLIFDECHKAKHFIPGKEKNSTKIAMAVTSIQRLLPKARVVYCSATGVTDVKNMAFMERLGLWGEGASFKTFEHFLDTITRKGLGAAEMLAMEMKASGMYVSRGLSFQEAEFETVETSLTEEQVKMYDMTTHVWAEVQRSLEVALGRTNTAPGRIWSMFWSCHQRFFKQLCLGVKVPTIVKEAKTSLAEGKCVVIGLQTTGEASLESEMTKYDTTLPGFVSVAREILNRFIQQHFPTSIVHPTGLEPEVDEWCSQAKELLLGFVKKIDMPNSPLDDIIDQLGGPSCVAEMTGRKGRVVRVDPGGSAVQYVLRSGEAGDVDSLNVQERNHFMNGHKLVAIISDAASTGISLHADTRVPNQRRRVHLTIELPWSADKAVQQMGRSHRSNESSGPLYKLLTTNLGGERRFASAVARRLQSLGALTQGDRRAATGADLTQFNFDTPYGRSALRTMYQAISKRELVGGVPLNLMTKGLVEFSSFNDHMRDCLVQMGVASLIDTSLVIQDKDQSGVGKFLNRILGLTVATQNMIFTYFFGSLQAAIAAARKEGKYNEGLVDIMASSIEMVGSPRVMFTDAKTSTPVSHVSLEVDRGMSWEGAIKRADNFQGKHDGFYRSKREQFGGYMYLLATKKQNSTHFYKICRPNTGVSGFDEDFSELLLRYQPVCREDAEVPWKDYYERSKDHCIHGPRCKNASICRVGARLYQLDLICGGTLTLMTSLECTLQHHAGRLQLSKTESSMRVVRVQLSNGKRVIGVRYPSILIPVAEEDLKEKRVLEKVQNKLGIGPSAVSSPSNHQASSAPDLSSVSKVIVTEDESPVQPKFVSKAMTPAPTLTSYFKVKEQPAVTKGTNPKTIEVIIDDNGQRDNSGKKRKHVDAVSDASSSESTQGDPGPKEFAAPSGKKPLQDIKNGSVLIPGSSLITSPPVKKCKRQPSILNSFQKAGESKVEKKVEKKVVCPICAKELPRGTMNKDLNKHIDTCLAAQ
eukprot:XP_011664067.1 PREDICTED: protein strawberry notch homolog 1 isoform X3 [Strongylocentrotus purpuratus]